MSPISNCPNKACELMPSSSNIGSHPVLRSRISARSATGDRVLIAESDYGKAGAAT
jgi:hypothetical protein